MALLYELGIDAGLEFIPVEKPLVLDQTDTLKEISGLARQYGLPGQSLKKAFEKEAICRHGQYHYRCPLTVALIHWVPKKYLK